MTRFARSVAGFMRASQGGGRKPQSTAIRPPGLFRFLPSLGTQHSFLSTVTPPPIFELSALEMRVLLSSSTLSAAADAYVWQANASTNYGSNTALQVKDSASSNDRWTYIRFNLSGISSSDAIADATLRLYGHVLQNSGDTSSINVVGYSSTDITWGESTITWNNKPTASGTSLASATVPYNNNADKWNTWDISSYIRSQKAAGASAVTLVLEPGNTTDSIASFASKEASSNQPQLVVTTVAAPSGLSASAASSSQINLSWTDNSDDETGFKIDRSTNAGSTWSSLTTTAANATSYSDTGLSASTTYTYRVRATNGSVDSANTAAASATTQSSGTTTTTDVSASADAYTRDGSYASTNYGSATGLYAKQYSTSNSGYNRDIYLTFDSSGVSGTLDSATVRLYGGISAGSGSESTAVRLYPITSPSWTETGIDWNNQPSAGTSLGYVTVASSTAQWYEWDVTSYVNSERANGRNVVGFMVRPDTTASTLFVFNSKETGSNPPDLRVTTSTASTPTVATAASVSFIQGPGMLALDVLGADAGGEAGLTYTWSATSSPSGSNVCFGDNGTNSAKDTSVGVDTAGSYTFLVNISNGTNSVTSSASYTITQAATDIALDDYGAAVALGGSHAFAATIYDQFGEAMATQPTVSWSVDSGGAGGTINSSTGLYTAPSSGSGSDSITSTYSSLSASATVQTGEFVGTVFNDSSGSGTRGADDPGISGWDLYIDANGNGSQDSGEATATTDAYGDYAFANSSGSSCQELRLVQQTGWTPTDGNVALITPGSPTTNNFGQLASGAPLITATNVTIHSSLGSSSADSTVQSDDKTSHQYTIKSVTTTTGKVGDIKPGRNQANGPLGLTTVPFVYVGTKVTAGTSKTYSLVIQPADGAGGTATLTVTVD